VVAVFDCWISDIVCHGIRRDGAGVLVYTPCRPGHLVDNVCCVDVVVDRGDCNTTHGCGGRVTVCDHLPRRLDIPTRGTCLQRPRAALVDKFWQVWCGNHSTTLRHHGARNPELNFWSK
jgi:hypothetical protein